MTSLERKTLLVSLADKYEVPGFCDEDPSQFLRWYSLDRITDVECASFIAAMLAFGNRKQFIPKIRSILELADLHGGIASWCCTGAKDFPHGNIKFYRFYSYDDMHCLFKELAQIITKYGSLGEYCRTNQKQFMLHTVLSFAFPLSAIVPKGKASANKRIHMFLRWMVRKNSPVDLGIWDWANEEDLIIPLDVHVMEEGKKLNLIHEKAIASYKTALELTERMKEIFPKDPCRADFALFGLGVDKNQTL